LDTPSGVALRNPQDATSDFPVLPASIASEIPLSARFSHLALAREIDHHCGIQIEPDKGPKETQ
jgi:hypothetical protein